MSHADMVAILQQQQQQWANAAMVAQPPHPGQAQQGGLYVPPPFDTNPGFRSGNG
jgi:hypothetical protein